MYKFKISARLVAITIQIKCAVAILITIQCFVKTMISQMVCSQTIRCRNSFIQSCAQQHTRQFSGAILENPEPIPLVA